VPINTTFVRDNYEKNVSHLQSSFPEMTSYVQDLLLAAKSNLVKRDPEHQRVYYHLQQCEKILSMMTNLLNQTKTKTANKE